MLAANGDVSRVASQVACPTLPCATGGCDADSGIGVSPVRPFPTATVSGRLRLLSLALGAFAVLASCSSSTEPSSNRDVLGDWQADSTGTSQESYERHLTLGADGSFSLLHRSFGVYDNQSADELSGFERVTGSFRIESDRLIFEPQMLLLWDYTFGRDAPTQVYTDYRYDHFYDDTHFTIDGETLTLHFTDYPADEPVSSTQVFQRAQ